MQNWLGCEIHTYISLEALTTEIQACEDFTGTVFSLRFSFVMMLQCEVINNAMRYNLKLLDNSERKCL